MKIELESISLKNFLSYGNVLQTLPFLPGVTLISGENGQGKSSLCDAVSFALYGRVQREINQNDLINWRNRKDCIVDIKFSKDNTVYNIIRGLKPHFVNIFENGTEVQFSGKRDSQEIIDEIIGINFQLYTNLIYSNINFSVPILKMSKGQKRDFITRLFNIEIFTRLQDSCKNKIKAIELKLNDFKNKKENLSVLIEEYKKIVNNATTTFADFSVQKLELEQTLAENKTAYPKDAILKIRDKLSSLREHKALADRVLGEYKGIIIASESQLNILREKLESLLASSICPTCEQKILPKKVEPKYKKRIEEIEKTIEEKNKSILELEKEKQDFIKQINYLEQEEINFNRATKIIEQTKGQLKSIIEHEKEIEITRKEFKEKEKEYKDKILRNKKEIDSILAEESKLKSLLDYLHCLRDQCKDDAIKQYAISSIIPLLNKYTNDYLAEVGFNFYLEIDKFVDAKIKGTGIFGDSTGNLSGGEGRAVNIALMMAFHDIARLKAKNFIDVMFCDEILDSSISATNIIKIFDIIKKKQKKDNLKVYIISHRQEIQDIDFDATINIEKEHGYTKIS